VVAVVLLLSLRAPAVMPPVYRVNIVAAPPGPRQIGEVVPQKPTTVPTPEVAPRPQQAPLPPPVPIKAAPVDRPAPPKATPTPTPVKPVTKPVPAQKAGGGPTGGRGTDVANVHINGIDFPYTGYLDNIVRQVALNFKPLDQNSGLRAEVSFMIHRDGSVDGLRFVTRSGDYGFDLEAQGAIQAAAKSFGALPDGFHDDVLPVVFSFDPQLLK
jgi:periplasmic protein TonB